MGKSKFYFVLLLFALFSKQTYSFSKIDIENLLQSYDFETKNSILDASRGLTAPSKPLRFSPITASTSFGDYRISCLLEKGRRSLVILFPGLGASQYGDDTQSRSETFFNGGHNVCAFSNSFQTDFYARLKIVPGDLKTESDFFWEATQSLLFQFKKIPMRVHFAGVSYGTHLLKEVLIKANMNWARLQKGKFINATMGRAVFISPPFSLAHSMEKLDLLWSELNPRLDGIGSLPLAHISLEFLDYAKGIESAPHFYSDEVYEAFILRTGFYLGMQDVAANMPKDLKIPREFNFADYVRTLFKPLVGRDIYSPLFSDGWQSIQTPALILHAMDDFINTSDDMTELQKMSDQGQNIFVASLPTGSHVGFWNREDIQKLILQFLKD